MECLEIVKKICGLAVLARKKGILALGDAIGNEGLFFKTMVEALLDSCERKSLETIYTAYLAAGNYHGREFLKNALIVNGLLLILEGEHPTHVVNGLQGWFGVKFAQTYKNEMAAELARLKPLPSPKEQSTIPAFDCLAEFSKEYMRKLLSEVDNQTLSIALKGASDKVADHFFSSMERSQAAEVRMSMEKLCHIRVKDVEDAQSDLLEKIKHI